MSKQVQALYRCTLLLLIILLSSCSPSSHAGQTHAGQLAVFVKNGSGNGSGTSSYSNSANLSAFDTQGAGRWKIPTSTFSTPLVSAENVEYDFINTPGVQDILQAIDAVTGKEHWHTAMHTFLAQKLTGTLMPLLTKSAVIVPGQAALLAFAISDGHLLWRHPIVGDLVRQPVITNNIVVIAATYKGPSAPCHDTKVEALNVTDGQSLWNNVRPGVPTTPTISDDSKTLFFSTYYDTCNPDAFSGSEIALSMSAGTVLWQTHQRYFAGDLHAHDSLIWASTNDNNSSANDGLSVTAFHADSGNVAWRYKTKGPISNIVLANNLLIFNEVHNDEQEPAAHMHLVALHIADGSVGWQADAQQRLYGDNDLRSGSLIQVNDTVGALVGTQTYGNGEAKDAQLVVYDAHDGHILHNTPLGINPSYLAYGQGIFYAITNPPLDRYSDMATLTAIQASTGSIGWQTPISPPVYALISIEH